jgi:hypothetical protein
VAPSASGCGIGAATARTLASPRSRGTALVLECDVKDQAQRPLAEWQQMVDLNVLGLLYCAHAALPHLLRAAADGPRQVNGV